MSLYDSVALEPHLQQRLALIDRSSREGACRCMVCEYTCQDAKIVTHTYAKEAKAQVCIACVACAFYRLCANAGAANALTVTDCSDRPSDPWFSCSDPSDCI